MCAAALFFMMTGGANAMLVALSQGYVVAAPGAVDGQLRLLTARIPARLRHLSSI